MARERVDPRVLVVDDVARILRCTVDTARRINRELLPSYPGPGRPRLYLYEDVISYIRGLGERGGLSGERVAEACREVLDFSPDSGRERSAKRRTQ